MILGIDLCKEKEIKCLDHGHVRLIDVMPSVVPEGATGDYAILQAARVSYGTGVTNRTDDRTLLRYLMRHQHTTPIEMCEVKFHFKLPIFVARQIIRHRTSNVNEYSGRYSEMKDEYYIPEVFKTQSKTNKQGSDQDFDPGENFVLKEELKDFCDHAYREYQSLLSRGVSRELARMVLPVNFYTEWYWKIDLHNLLHFLALRCDSHAQSETQVFGNAVLKLIEPIFPMTIEAWNDYHPMRGAMKLTRLEIECLRNCGFIDKEFHNTLEVQCSPNKRENAEFIEKLKLIYGNNNE